MEVPALAEDHYRLSPRLKQACHAGVFVNLDSLFPGRAKGAEFCVFKFEVLRKPEEFHILGVAPRIPRLDPGDSQIVQRAYHRKLVLRREIYALALGSVPEGGVENFHQLFFLVLF